MITGLGGIGKTQTVLAYADRHLADCRLVWWLRAETPVALAADYAAMAEHLGVPETADQPKQIETVRRALEGMEGWLLVFDNVEDPAVVRDYFPRRGDGRVLLTSRRTDWRGIAKALPLDVLPEADAVALLSSGVEVGPDGRAEAAALAEELGYLPLALTQAWAYVTGTGLSFADYRALLAARRVDLLRRGVPNDHKLPVLLTWGPSLEAAETECPAARSLLELLAFFAADPLPRTTLAAMPEALPEALRDPLSLGDAIAALTRLSLIRAEGGSIAVHRLVQAVTRDGLDEATARARAETAVRLVNAALPRPARQHTNWPAIGTLLPHALAAVEAAERLGAALEDATAVLNRTALYHSARAAYAEAERLYQRALAIGEKVLGPEHPNVGIYYGNLASVLQDTGRYAAAEPLRKRAVEIHEKALGLEHPVVATSLNNLAILYQATGRYGEAEPLYRRALAIGEKALDPDHPDVTTGLNNLAGLYRDTGRYDEAEPLYRRVLAIDEKARGEDHPVVATGLNNLAGVYRATGRYAEAEPLYRRALATREKALGPDHPDVAASLNNLAGLYRATGRYDEAEPLYRHALKIIEKTLPADHPHLMRGIENYAALLEALGRTTEAFELRARAEAIRRRRG